MAAVESNMLTLGTKAANFTLYNPVSKRHESLDQLKSETATVIMFICNHCPFVKHINHEMVKLADEYTAKGISFIAINSNDVENYPDDSPENMIINANELGFNFPYLFDESQDIAKAYKAACTPDFYIFDKDLACVYRGQFDNSRPGNGIPVSGSDIRKALDTILSGNKISENQKASIGCNIKWK
jgi:thiol-disulfide isomerase/thioredoxin